MITGAQRVQMALAHRPPDKVPIDFGGTFVTGIHVSLVGALRRHYCLEPGPVKVLDPGQMLGEVGDDLRAAMGIDTQCVPRLMTRFGFPNTDWKVWRMYDGVEVLVPGQFNFTLEENGDTLLYPQGDTSAPASARMPKGGYFFKVFAGQCEIALANLAKIAARVGDLVDVVYICGTDFGTQKSSFCSVETFRELWMPYYQRLTSWIHKNTRWKVFKHSCGAVEKFIPSFIECGFDILNPVQCSAAGMDPERLKEAYGDMLVFWGGGVDTQQTLPFGTPQQVREQVLRRCEILAPGGGFVFNAIHNLQAHTPVENVVAMIDAVHEFNGRM